MKKMTNFLIFLTGAVAGAAGAWYFLKERYETFAEEEIASVKEAYAAREEAVKNDGEETPERPSVGTQQPPEKPDLMGYAKKLQEEGYVDYASTVVEKKPPARKEEQEVVKPYVISPDDFGEKEGYPQVSLTYFADGVITDEDDEPIDNPEEIIGDALDHFGEYARDAVFVRNDARKCDYEILRDNRRFYEARQNRPPAVPEEDEGEED